MTYQIAAGTNNLVGLTDVDPQPRSTGIQYPARVTTPSAVYNDGPAYTEWVFSVLTRAQFTALRTAFGLTDETIYATVTIRTLNNDDSFLTYNGRIIGPEINRDPQFWRNIRFRILDLERTS